MLSRKKMIGIIRRTTRPSIRKWATLISTPIAFYFVIRICGNVTWLLSAYFCNNHGLHQHYILITMAEWLLIILTLGGAFWILYGWLEDKCLP